MDLISRSKIIKEIRAHAQRVGSENDLYQLAHDHIIRIIENEPIVTLSDDTFIHGYRLKDLIVIAERIRKDKVDPVVLKADNEAFLEGYKRARDDFNEQLKKSIDNIINRE